LERESADREGPSLVADGCRTTFSNDPIGGHDRDSVLFKNDKIYRHHIARFNYTTYDIRRAQDVINPNTSHCDIMVLANFESEDTSQTPFWYGRVLGIYHANVVYTGPGMVDYTPRRFEFLWVRWYRSVAPMHPWHACRLDMLEFPPMANDDSFGFLDPRDVLRGCHITPAFKSGKVHVDGVGLSRCAKDAQDWSQYYVNRLV
jgi:hypothetical protein